MTTTQAQAVLMEALLPYFDHKRYEPVDAWQQFRRDTSFGHSAVLFGVSPAPKGVLIEVFAGIRHHAVETLMGELFGNADWYGAQSHTLVVSWAQLWPEVLIRRYPCRNEREVDALADVVIEFMDAKGFDFLHRLRTMESLSHLFNDSHEVCCTLTNRAWQRCFRGLLLAGMTRRKDMPQLYEHHRSTLLREGMAGAVVEKFDHAYIRIGSSVAN